MLSVSIYGNVDYIVSIYCSTKFRTTARYSVSTIVKKTSQIKTVFKDDIVYITTLR